VPSGNGSFPSRYALVAISLPKTARKSLSYLLMGNRDHASRGIQGGFDPEDRRHLVVIVCCGR